jgi:hypothetical protein
MNNDVKSNKWIKVSALMILTAISVSKQPKNDLTDESKKEEILKIDLDQYPEFAKESSPCAIVGGGKKC